LLAVAHDLIGISPTARSPALANWDKVEAEDVSKSPQELLAKRVERYDGAALLPDSAGNLLNSAYQCSGLSNDFLTHAAKRYRVDIEELQKVVAGEFAPKREKTKAKGKGKAVAQ
jgi:hypothetical protein